MSAAHTPGPWEQCAVLHAAENHHGFNLVDGRGWRLGFIEPIDDCGEAGNANARVISAAPELLEALQGIIRNQSADWPAIGFNLNAARAAISKATGVAA